MQQQIEAPTPQALADLVARCDQIDRYTTLLVAAEETRVAALASGILVMRQVLDLRRIPPEKLPVRQRRFGHWALTGGGRLADVVTPTIESLAGALVIDEHEQVKILSQRSWRGVWKQVTLWRDGVEGLAASELLQYLVRLTSLAQRHAPSVARTLLERSRAVADTSSLLPIGPRTRAD